MKRHPSRFLMPRSFAFILVAAIGLVLTPGVRAQKIGTIDLQKVFDGYWKTKQADKLLKDRQQDFKEARDNMIQEYETANSEYRKLAEGANDQAVSRSERDRRKQEAETKLLDVREIESSVKQFDQQAIATLEDQKKRARNDIVREIKDLVIQIAKRDRYSLILDVSGNTFNQTPLVLYSDGTADISEEILRTLNTSAPAGFSP